MRKPLSHENSLREINYLIQFKILKVVKPLTKTNITFKATMENLEVFKALQFIIGVIIEDTINML